MTRLSQTILLKRWSLYLKDFLDIDMVEDLEDAYGNELEEACAKILNVVEVCGKEDHVLSPEMAAGVLTAILAECASVPEFPAYPELLEVGYLLAKETGFSYTGE